jgi:hypothetical protein
MVHLYVKQSDNIYRLVFVLRMGDHFTCWVMATLQQAGYDYYLVR